MDEGDRSASFFCRVVKPFLPADRDAVVAGEALLVAGRDQCLALPEQELLQVDLAGAELLIICKMDIGNFYRPLIAFVPSICYTDSRRDADASCRFRRYTDRGGAGRLRPPSNISVPCEHY